jgi:hypothetical protein
MRYEVDDLHDQVIARLDHQHAVESEMTALDGFIACLAVMRRSDGLETRPTDATSWDKWAAEFHGLTTIIDATVARARKLSRTIHGEEAIREVEPEAS